MDFEKNYHYFHIMGHEESHLVRRRQILSAHPEIKALYGYDKASVWVSLTLNLAQLFMLQFVGELSWFWYILSAFVIGGTISHSC